MSRPEFSDLQLNPDFLIHLKANAIDRMFRVSDAGAARLYDKYGEEAAAIADAAHEPATKLMKDFINATA